MPVGTIYQANTVFSVIANFGVEMIFYRFRLNNIGIILWLYFELSHCIQGVPNKMTPFVMQMSPKIIARNHET